MILTVVGRVAAAVAAVAAIAAIAACSVAADDGAGGAVVATTGIWADVAGQVACDGSLDVRSIVPAGGDPHSFEPSLRDREVLDGATLVVANGLGLEESLDDTLASVEADGVPLFRVGDHVDAPGDDPHVWLDPTRVAAALPALGDALVDAGADPEAIHECVATATTELAALDEELAATFAAIPDERRLLVTNHDALGHLADRYGFEIVGSVLPSTSTLSAASPRELEELEAAIEAAGVPAIFTERFSDSTDAAALADRLGVEVVELYSDALGEPGSGADTYAGMMRADAAAIAAALSR